jgi:ABC-type uncharacterized transport system substrate-binding protein
MVVGVVALWHGAVASAAAHPHVFVNAKAEFVYDGRGNVVAINHVWTFDEAYSAFATMGFPKTADGKLDPAKLAELARLNVESLVDFGYFSDAKSAGRRVDFAAPKTYRLEYHGTALTLFMTLPLRRPMPGRTFTLDVSDPTFFVAFTFDEAADAIVLTNAPANCSLNIRRPQQADFSRFMTLSDEMFAQLSEGNADVQRAFSNQARVACP